jgi:hypothetical protein
MIREEKGYRHEAVSVWSKYSKPLRIRNLR